VVGGGRNGTNLVYCLAERPKSGLRAFRQFFALA